MDWKAALALVKTQQELLNVLLSEETQRNSKPAQARPALQAPSTTTIKKRLISPSADEAVFASPSNTVPSAALEGTPQVTIAAGSRDDDDDGGTTSVGSPVPDADDIVGTPIPPQAQPFEARGKPICAEERESGEEIESADADKSIEQPVVIVSAEELVMSVLTEECSFNRFTSPQTIYCRGGDSCALLVSYFDLAGDEYAARQLIELSEDEAWCTLTMLQARCWAAFECACTAEHSLLDKMTDQIETLDVAASVHANLRE